MLGARDRSRATLNKIVFGIKVCLKLIPSRSVKRICAIGFVHNPSTDYKQILKLTESWILMRRKKEKNESARRSK